MKLADLIEFVVDLSFAATLLSRAVCHISLAEEKI
jgi:hypothetical protein